MSDIVIRAEDLRKKYQLQRDARDRRPYHSRSLRETLMERAGRLFSRGESCRTRVEDLWALREIGFEVHRGDVVGIVGRNGAGKSTLLKILSRITEPTEGRVHIKGRVASLLEVGTGFHPELTGRENIFLNGAILGMTRAEIRRKFDEIVAFAEVEKFIDTPVKRYSSGMYVRLAFAVAAHLEPDVLVIDEVLAVGDIAFQRKCLGKLESVARQQRAVLVVSHNMSIVSQLCKQVMWLDHGRVVQTGPTREVVGAYLAQGSSSADTWSPPSRGIVPLQLHSVSIVRDDDATGDIAGDESFEVVFDY